MDISIVIPAYNRKDRLRQCLDSLFKQDYPQEDFEIIIVDDGSDDGTGEMVKEIAKEKPNLRYFLQSHKGPAVARNRGIIEAKAEIIGFTDNDCILKNDWIRKMVLAHRLENGIMAVGGLTRVNRHNIKALVSQSLSDGAIAISINGKAEVIFLPTCNVSLKKSYLNGEKFNELFLFPAGEDLEFFWKLFKNGKKFIYRRDIEVFHDCHPNIKSFLNQAYMYGRGNFLAQHMHKDHPLLKELKPNKFFFWIATLVNIIKAPRFSYSLGRRLIEERNIKEFYRKLSVYSCFFVHKIFYLSGNIMEFLRIRRGLLKKREAFSVPELLILDVTHSCNISCRICDIWKTGSIEENMKIQHIKKMFHQAKKLGIKEIALSGGEPLLREDIFRIFDYARITKINKLGVLTNGILVERYFERLKPYIIDNSVSLVVSLDSLNRDTHNYVRNSHISWQKAIKSLKLLSLLKKEYPQVNFNVITIILNQNLEELLDIAIFIKSLGANSLQLQALLPNNLRMAERKKSIFWVSQDRLSLLDDILEKIAEFKMGQQQFIKNSIKNLALMKKYYRGIISSDDIQCQSAYKTILVSNRGACTTCFSDYGNIKKRCFKRILQSEEIIKAQRQVKECPWPCLLPCFCDC